jgi:putative glutamine amidotransferase
MERSQTGVWDVDASFLPKVYIDAVTKAGGIAVLLPPQPVDDEIARRALSAIDGLIVSGGKDVDPARYGQKPLATTDAPPLDRDAWEDALLHRAIADEVPFLAICRGLQLLNVALGGTLHQNLPEVIGSARYSGQNGVFATNHVDFEHDGIVPALLGAEKLKVNSYHHQGIHEVAPGLAVTATSEGGVIQAVEVEAVPFGVGVQWHPEQDPDDVRLFQGLVEAARKHRG